MDEHKWAYKKLGSEDLYQTAELDLGTKFGTSMLGTKSHKKILKVLDKISILLKHGETCDVSFALSIVVLML